MPPSQATSLRLVSFTTSWPGSAACWCSCAPHLLSFAFCCRKDWEDRAAKLGEAFDIREAAGKLSEDTLRRAKALHEAQGGVKASRLALMCAMAVYLHLVMV